MVVVEGVCHLWRLVLYIFRQVENYRVKLNLFLQCLSGLLVGFGANNSVEVWVANILYLTTQPPHTQSM